MSTVLSNNIYNYYELAIQKWCTDDYMIHGLWPQIDKNNYPVYCENVSYNYPNGSLLDNMNKYWNSCDDTIWEHEWTKHGSCVKLAYNIDEYDFFNITINLFKKYNSLINKCNEENCILGCFDLQYKLIKC